MVSVNDPALSHEMHGSFVHQINVVERVVGDRRSIAIDQHATRTSGTEHASNALFVAPGIARSSEASAQQTPAPPDPVSHRRTGVMAPRSPSTTHWEEHLQQQRSNRRRAGYRVRQKTNTLRRIRRRAPQENAEAGNDKAVGNSTHGVANPNAIEVETGLRSDLRAREKRSYAASAPEGDENKTPPSTADLPGYWPGPPLHPSGPPGPVAAIYLREPLRPTYADPTRTCVSLDQNYKQIQFTYAGPCARLTQTLRDP